MGDGRLGHRTGVMIAVLASIVVIPALIVGVMLGARWVLHRTPGSAIRAELAKPAGYVGASACITCHEPEYTAWRGSDHDRAMQPATPETVLADFDDATFEAKGVTSRFFRRDGNYMVETQGPDGARHEYVAAYTFGVRPLQQYLLALPGGRYQAFTIAWDTRPAEQGGQRWFDLYPNEQTPPGDELHWAAPAHNWNFACAECHSTDLRKNYDIPTDTYATTWSEINVSCEACHGPGSRHVAIAQLVAQGKGTPGDATQGLAIRFPGPGGWTLEPGAASAWLEHPAKGDDTVEACGRCHARRSQLTEDYVFARPLSDTHHVQLLNDPYYFPDGQIEDEVYVYASFRQSKMYSVGVSCSDCHDPHTLKTRAQGNALCLNCHAAATFDVPEHHHHEADSEGALCVECHMPARTYMVVDPRRDHSIRIPRPDLSVALGVPNACNQCHTDQTAQWAADAVVEWYGKDFKPGFQTYARAFEAARRNEPGSAKALAAVVHDPTLPAIARATAIDELASRLEPSMQPTVELGLKDPDPLVRRAGIDALIHADRDTRLRLVAPLLEDPILDVRLAAAESLSDVRPEDVDPKRRPILLGAFEAYVDSQRTNADRAESWVNLAGFHFRQGDVAAAQKDYDEALRRNPGFVPIYVNRADMERSLGHEDQAERTLRAGLRALPDAPAIHHALGLSLVRSHRSGEALTELERAWKLGAQDPRFGYVYGVALDSMNQPDRAIEVWTDVLERHPNDVSTLQALAVGHFRRGEFAAALPQAERLAALTPNDPNAQALLDAVRQKAGGQTERP